MGWAQTVPQKVTVGLSENSQVHGSTPPKIAILETEHDEQPWDLRVSMGILCSLFSDKSAAWILRVR